MLLDTPDGKLRIMVTKVHPDGSYDWVSEDGCHSGTGTRGKPTDDAGNVTEPREAVNPASHVDELITRIAALEVELNTLRREI